MKFSSKFSSKFPQFGTFSSKFPQFSVTEVTPKKTIPSHTETIPQSLNCFRNPWTLWYPWTQSLNPWTTMVSLKWFKGFWKNSRIAKLGSRISVKLFILKELQGWEIEFKVFGKMVQGFVEWVMGRNSRFQKKLSKG